MGDSEVPLKAKATASVRPLDRDAGIEQTVEPVINRKAPASAAQAEAVRAGVNDAMMAGPVEGAPLQDVAVKLDRLTLFQMALLPALRIVASQAVREAIQQAGGQVLRPLMDVEVVVPDENLGTVLGETVSFCHHYGSRKLYGRHDRARGMSPSSIAGLRHGTA